KPRLCTRASAGVTAIEHDGDFQAALTITAQDVCHFEVAQELIGIVVVITRHQRFVEAVAGLELLKLQWRPDSRAVSRIIDEDLIPSLCDIPGPAKAADDVCSCG